MRDRKKKKLESYICAKTFLWLLSLRELVWISLLKKRHQASQPHEARAGLTEPIVMTRPLSWAIILCACQRPLPLPVSSVKEGNSSRGLFSRWPPSVTSFPSSPSPLSTEMKFTCPFPNQVRRSLWGKPGVHAGDQCFCRAYLPLEKVDWAFSVHL